MSFCIGGGATANNPYGTLAATDYIDALRKLGAFLDSGNFHAASAVINNAGSGYVVDDVVQLATGSPVLNMVASFRVTAEAGGAVTAVEPASMGCYPSTTAGTNRTTTAVVGTGVGLTLDITAGTNGYTIERDEVIAAGVERELIVNAQGLDAGQSIYWGYQTHRSVVSDYYNIKLAGFTGYNGGLEFLNQPGLMDVDGSPAVADIPLLNSTLPFWFYVNDQRVFLVFRPGSVYILSYAGYGLPFGPSTSYPYPLHWSGTARGPERGTPFRFSESSNAQGWQSKAPLGSNFIRWVDGAMYPCARYNDAGGSLISGDNYLKSYPDLAVVPTGYSFNGLQQDPDDFLTLCRDTNGEVPLLPVVIWDGGTNQDFFEGYAMQLDRVFAIPGFQLSSEDTKTLDGKKYRCFQNVWRSARGDYFCVEES